MCGRTSPVRSFSVLYLVHFSGELFTGKAAARLSIAVLIQPPRIGGMLKRGPIDRAASPTSVVDSIASAGSSGLCLPSCMSASGHQCAVTEQSGGAARAYGGFSAADASTRGAQLRAEMSWRLVLHVGFDLETIAFLLCVDPQQPHSLPQRSTIDRRDTTVVNSSILRSN